MAVPVYEADKAASAFLSKSIFRSQARSWFQLGTVWDRLLHKVFSAENCNPLPRLQFSPVDVAPG
jgi:hypothetical protein